MSDFTIPDLIIFVIFFVVIILLGIFVYFALFYQEPIYYMTHPDAIMYCHTEYNNSDCYNNIERDGHGWSSYQYCNAIEKCTAKNNNNMYKDRSLGYCTSIGFGYSKCRNGNSIVYV